MWVCGRSTATRGPPGPVRPSVNRPPYFDLAFGSPQRAGELRGHLEAHVVAGARVALARVAEPDDSESSRTLAAAIAASGGGGIRLTPRRTRRPRRRLGLALGGGLALGRLGLALLADQLGLLLDLLGLLDLGGNDDRRDDRLLQRRPGTQRPRAAVSSERCMVAAISIPDTSTVMKSGMSVGSASMLSWCVTCSITPPSLMPGASSTPSMWSATGAWIFSSRRTSSRSMCMTSPRTGCSCWSFTITGRVLPPAISRSISADPSTSTWRSTRWSTLNDVQSPSVPPYTTPGTTPSRRSRRTARLPRSARSSTASVGRLESAIRRASVAGAEGPTYPQRGLGAARRQLDSRPDASAARRRWARRSARRAPATPGPAPPTSPAPRRRRRRRSTRRHLEAAERMVRDARANEGRGDEDGAARLVHRHRVPARRVPRALPGAARHAAHLGAADALEEGANGCCARSGTSPCDELFERFDSEASAAASIGQVHRARAARRARGGGQDPVPRAWPTRSAPTCRTPGMIMRMAKALAPGLDAKAAAEELKERVMEELDYELEAQNQRAFARGYRDHPFIYVPDVVTRLSTRRVLVSEWVDGVGFDEVARPAAERARPLRRDRLPLLLRLDLPPAALQRRRPSRQLPADAGRPRGVPRLRHDQAARLGPDRARGGGAGRRVFDDDPERLRVALHDLGFLRDPKKVDAEQLMQHVRRDRRLVHGGRAR